MAVFRAEVTRRVTVDVLCIDIGSVLDKRLNHTEVTSQARNVQRSTEIVRTCVDLRTELDQYFDEGRVTLTRCQM